MIIFRAQLFERWLALTQVKFQPGPLFLFIKSTLSDNFLYFFRVSNHQIIGKEN